jgi:hypothetical protein
MADGLSLMGVGQGRDLHALEGRGCRVLAAVLPLPGVKTGGWIGQHSCRKGSPEDNCRRSIIIVDGNL